MPLKFPTPRLRRIHSTQSLFLALAPINSTQSLFIELTPSTTADSHQRFSSPISSVGLSNGMSNSSKPFRRGTGCAPTLSPTPPPSNLPPSPLLNHSKGTRARRKHHDTLRYRQRVHTQGVEIRHFLAVLPPQRSFIDAPGGPCTLSFRRYGLHPNRTTQCSQFCVFRTD